MKIPWWNAPWSNLELVYFMLQSGNMKCIVAGQMQVLCNQLTNLDWDKMADGCQFADVIFFCTKIVLFSFKFQWNLFLRDQSTINHCFDIGLAPNRQEVIVWTWQGHTEPMWRCISVHIYIYSQFEDVYLCAYIYTNIIVTCKCYLEVFSNAFCTSILLMG